MVVLHAHWQPPTQQSGPGTLLFWAETSDVPQPARQSRHVRKTPAHPFAAPAPALRALLKRLIASSVFPIALDAESSIELALPTAKTAPLPSPALIHEWDLPGAGEPTLAWLRAGFPWPMARAPRLAQLARAMPPICRAQWTFPKAQPANTPEPYTLLTSFLEGAVDVLARQWGRTAAVAVAQQGIVHEWLGALVRSDARLHGSSTQLDRLRASHQAWLRSLYAAGNRHVRVAFQLAPPAQPGSDAAGQTWTLQYLLQAREDPSLLAPAATVWQAHADELVALGRGQRDAQEILLTGLGFTARLFAPVRASLQDKQPHAAHFSSQDAFTFLREVAPTLEESGFGVLVPPWWNRPGARLGVRPRMRGQNHSAGGVAASLVSFENLINYRWEIALGGETLSRQEFEAMVALKTPLVQVRGQWVRLDPDQIEAAIRFWEQGDRQGEIGLLEALQVGLGAERAGGLPVEDIQLEGWLQDWMQRFTRQETLALHAIPAGLQAQLRPY
jgi:hypothetical protein